MLVGGGASSALGSPVVVCVYNSERYSVRLFRISYFLFEIFPCFVLDGGSSPLFRACQFFHKLIVSCCCISLDDGDVKKRCLQTNGYEAARDWSASHDGIHGVFVNEECNSMLMSVLTATEELVAFWCRRFSKVFFFQRTSQSPNMFHWYLFISCVSSSTFPAALSDLTFQVPIVMLFPARR